MKILIQNGRVIDPARGFDQVCDVAIAAGRVVAIGAAPAGFAAERVIDASGQWVLPGLVDLAVRLREPGHEHEGMLASEMAASVAGGVTSLVCLPDTDPVLDEQGLVEMLKLRAKKLHQAGATSWSTMRTALIRSRREFDRAHREAVRAIHKAIK